MPRPRTKLSPERIAEAAAALIDETRGDGFTMRDLAARLNVDPMAIYHHLPNKAAVVHAAVDRLVGEIALPPCRLAWARRVRAIASGLRAMARRHPGVFALACVHEDYVAAEFPLREALLAAIADAGLNDRQTVHAASAVLGYAAGFALDEITGALGPPGPEGRAALRALPRDVFPQTARLAEMILAAEPDAEFAFGLDLLIEGIAARAQKRRRRRKG